MSLTLTLRVTPEEKQWVGTATLEEDSKDRYTQKELAMRLRMTGEEVTSTLGDLNYLPCYQRDNWCDYRYVSNMKNRDICLMQLKGAALSILKYLGSKTVDVYVKAVVIHDQKSLGWSLSKTTNTYQEIEDWQG
jgi:hypothetical protein